MAPSKRELSQLFDTQVLDSQEEGAASPGSSRRKSSKLVAHTVNTDLIYSGEIWILDSANAWRKKICRFDGRYIVFVKPSTAAIPSKLVPSFQKQPKEWMSTTVSDRYFPVGSGCVPALDSPMLSVPKDPFRLLIGKPGQWIQAKERYPDFDIVDLITVTKCSVLTRSKYASDGQMLHKIFVMHRENGKQLFCRFRKDHEFKSWLFCISCSLRFLKPEIRSLHSDAEELPFDDLAGLEEDLQAYRKEDDMYRKLNRLTGENVLDDIHDDIHRNRDSVIHNMNDDPVAEKSVSFDDNTVIIGEVCEQNECESVVSDSSDEEEMDDGLPLGVIFHKNPATEGTSDDENMSIPPDSNNISPILAILEPTPQELPPPIIGMKPKSRDKSQSESSNRLSAYGRRLIRKVSVPTKQEEISNQADTPRPPSLVKSDEMPNEGAAPEDTPMPPARRATDAETGRLVKIKMDAAHKPKVIEVDSSLYRQLSKHGVVGSPTISSPGKPPVVPISMDAKGEALTDPDMASLYADLLSRLDNAGLGGQ